jgi:hypothetical protein
MGARNQLGTELFYRSASLSSLAGRYDNPIPTRYLAPIDCSKIPAQKNHLLKEFGFTSTCIISGACGKQRHMLLCFTYIVDKLNNICTNTVLYRLPAISKLTYIEASINARGTVSILGRSGSDISCQISTCIM